MLTLLDLLVLSRNSTRLTRLQARVRSRPLAAGRLGVGGWMDSMDARAPVRRWRVAAVAAGR